MKNSDIFQETHAPYSTRHVHGFDSVANTGSCAVGHIVGDARTISAVVTSTATEEDQWQIVNLKGSKNGVSLCDSVAVLGAVDKHEAESLANRHFGRFFDAVATEVLPTNPQGLKRYLNSDYYNQSHGVVKAWALDELQDVLTSEKPLWDGISLTSHQSNTARLLLDMQLNDDHSGLLTPSEGLSAVLEQVGAEYEDFDSIIVE